MQPGFQTDPFRQYKMLREFHPVCQIEPNGMWAISRYKDVQFVLKNPKLFSSTANNLAPNAKWYREECQNPRILFAQDPPEHTKYHNLVNRAFLNNVLRSVQPLMRETALTLTRNLVMTNGRCVDFAESFSYPYVGRVVRNLIGIDDSQSLEELREWVSLEEQCPPSRPSDDFIKRYEKAVIQQNQHFLQVIENRRRNPGFDLATQIANGSVDGQPLSDKECCSLMNLLVASGFSTTIHMLNNAIMQLSRQQGLVQTLSQEPTLIPKFIEELLRCHPAVHSAFRRARSDITVSGTTIPKGSLIMPLLASANRDEQVFNDPDAFDIYRSNAQSHITFGYGIHTCIGAALARLELRIALETLLDHIEHIHCPCDDELQWIQSPFIRGVLALPAEFRAGSSKP